MAEESKEPDTDDKQAERKQDRIQVWWGRIADEKKFPRGLWWPQYSGTKLKDDDLRKEHQETSNTIRRVLLMVIGFSFFCLLTLGVPDVSLLATDARIKVPFADTEVSFGAFFSIGPLVLIGLTIYLQIFVAHWLTLGGRNYENTAPYIFNINRKIPNFISGFLIYWLVPFTLTAFTWKALPRPDPEPTILISVTIIVTWCLVVLQIRRCPGAKKERILRNLPLWLIMFFALTGLEETVRRAVSGEPQFFIRQWDLVGAKLSGADLRGLNLADTTLLEADLSRAKLTRANLAGANLTMVDLNVADLTETDLRGAILRDSNLTGAILTKANLENSDLTGANLERAKLNGANLQGAKLAEAILIGSELTAANLSGADLSGANLGRAQGRETNFGKANLSGADLSGALLWEANLQEAVLIGAKLKGTMLTQANFANADLTNADLSGARLDEANLVDANLIHANLSGAILMSANLSRADLTSTVLTNANLTGADLALTDLRETKGLNCVQLQEAKNWRFAYRNEYLACGAGIPEPPSK